MTIVETYKGYEIRVQIYIASDGLGAAPTSWNEGSTGVNLLGVATSASTSGSASATDITGLNQQEPYNTKQGNISYEWSISQLYTLSEWTDSSSTNINPMDMLGSGKKCAIQISGMSAAGEDSSTNELDIVLTRCSVDSDELSVEGSEGDWTLTMSGRAATRDASSHEA